MAALKRTQNPAPIILTTCHRESRIMRCSWTGLWLGHVVIAPGGRGPYLYTAAARGACEWRVVAACRAQKLDRSIMRPAHKHDEDLRARVLRRSFQLGRVDAAQMAPARRAHVVQSNGVGASTFCRWRSLKMNTWSRHSVLTDLTQRSAIALARGDLKGVRAWVMPRLRTRRSKLPA